jgi:hypothetical protein
MSRILALIFLSAACLSALAQSKLAIVNASVLDVRANAFRPQQTVVIENGSIVAVDDIRNTRKVWKVIVKGVVVDGVQQ